MCEKQMNTFCLSSSSSSHLNNNNNNIILKKTKHVIDYESSYSTF